MPVLSIQNLCKNYGRIKALDNLNLDINAGEIYGLLGPNGSGKTTTLGIILGILKSDSGSFTWFDTPDDPYHRKKIGAILETPNFYPYMNAQDNLEIVAHIKGVKNVNYVGLLEQVNLADRQSSAFKSYSLGMKQRLAIAATLIGDPEVVIFDEPTNGLDPQGISEVRSILKNVADSGRTVIMASHLLDEVEKICSHVAIIKKGVLLASGRVGEMLSNDILIELASDNLDKLRIFLNTLPWIDKIYLNGQVLQCNMKSDHSAQELNHLAFTHNITLTHLVSRKQKLEEEFLKITKKTQ